MLVLFSNLIKTQKSFLNKNSKSYNKFNNIDELFFKMI